jgi:quercetin dioxygenase-like cupin family protein
MKTSGLPEMIPLKNGESLKIFQINAKARMKMPLHHSTKEAVVVIQEGQALLKINNEKHLLQKDSTFIIPAQQNHTLSVKTKFKALLIMAEDSKIEFMEELSTTQNN